MKPLTLKQLKQLSSSISGFGGEIVGFIGGVPVVSRDDCPKGMMYVLNEDKFKKLGVKKK